MLRIYKDYSLNSILSVDSQKWPDARRPKEGERSSLLAVRLSRRQGNKADGRFSESNDGFTLIETMAAMLILALVCVAYSQNQMGAIQLVKATRFRQTATLLATQKMAETNFLVTTKGIEQIKDDDKGEFDQEKYEGYTWHIWKNKVAAPDFTALISQAGGEAVESDGQNPQAGFEGPMRMITDIWGKSIIELHLEVTWKEGEQEKSYTLMTHYMTSDASGQLQGLIGSLTGGAGASGSGGSQKKGGE